MHESIVFCSMCMMSSYRKFTFAISSPDEFLVFVLSQCTRLTDRWTNIRADGQTDRKATGRLHCIRSRMVKMLNDIPAKCFSRHKPQFLRLAVA